MRGQDRKPRVVHRDDERKNARIPGVRRRVSHRRFVAMMPVSDVQRRPARERRELQGVRARHDPEAQFDPVELGPRIRGVPRHAGERSSQGPVPVRGEQENRLQVRLGRAEQR